MVDNVGSVLFFGFIFSFLLVFGVIFFAIYRRKHVIKKYPAIKVTVDAIYRMRIAVGSGSDSNMYNIFIVLKDLSTGKKYTISDSEFDDKKCMHVGAIGELHIVREYPDVIQVKDGVLYIHGKSTIFVGSGDLGDGVVHTLKDPKNPIYNLDGENNTKKLEESIYVRGEAVFRLTQES